LATWMPFWLVMIALVMPQANSSTRWLATALVGALTLLSVVMPARGLADRLAGTWPIPR